jgi:hypothetical protein
MHRSEDELGHSGLLSRRQCVLEGGHAASARVELREDLGAAELLACVEVGSHLTVRVCRCNRVATSAAGGDKNSASLLVQPAVVSGAATAAKRRAGEERYCDRRSWRHASSSCTRMGLGQEAGVRDSAGPESAEEECQERRRVDDPPELPVPRPSATPRLGEHERGPEVTQ